MSNLDDFTTPMVIPSFSTNQEEHIKHLESTISQLHSNFNSFLAQIEQLKQIDLLIQQLFTTSVVPIHPEKTYFQV